MTYLKCLPTAGSDFNNCWLPIYFYKINPSSKILYWIRTITTLFIQEHLWNILIILFVHRADQCLVLESIFKHNQPSLPILWVLSPTWGFILLNYYENLDRWPYFCLFRDKARSIFLPLFPNGLHIESYSRALPQHSVAYFFNFLILKYLFYCNHC